MRLIDADKLTEAIKNELWDWETVDGITATTVLKQTITDISNQPTIDTEPIVRCKDCKFYDPLDANRPYDCMYMDSIFGDDYCSRGVGLRKTSSVLMDKKRTR